MTWLERLIERILSVFPRLWLVDPDEAGVRVTLGTRVKAASPGWYVFWPIIQAAEKIKVTPQVIDLRGQSITTKDGKTAVISGAIQYKVIDATKAILSIHDYDKAVQTLALGCIAKIYEISREIQQLENEILKSIREVAAGFGLKIMRVFITDLCEAKTFRIIGDGQIIPETTYIEEKMFGL